MEVRDLASLKGHFIRSYATVLKGPCIWKMQKIGTSKWNSAILITGLLFHFVEILQDWH
jgi:hypothetical protein